MSTDYQTLVPTLRTVKGEITLEAALEEEQDMLRRLTHLEKRTNFLSHLLANSAKIAAIVSFHLGLSGRGSCEVAPAADWLVGGYNVCIPVHVKSDWKGLGKRVMIRFPLPYKVGEEEFPGNVEEKLRCEAATYIWIQKNCPDVPIPQLWGFAFQDNECFTSLKSIPWYIRLMVSCRRYVRSLFGYPPLCPYICRHQPHTLEPGYLLMEYIEEDEGIMLSESWEEKRQDKSRRTNLFRDLSRIIISLGRIPLARIGSFTLDKTGVLSLTNRPLTLRLQELESHGIPVNIARGDTYTAVEPYLLDLLAYHDSRLRHQPNSIIDDVDCRGQMAAITGMRAVLPHFIDRNLRDGPFLFTLTDINQNNLFVDEQWHVKRVVDLEWACSLPLQMQNTPHWLTSLGVDELIGEHFTEYEMVREEFMQEFETEEKLQDRTKVLRINNDLPRTRTMRRAWETGSFFYFRALDSTVGLFNLWGQNIQPRFSKADSHLEEKLNAVLAPYWCHDAEVVTAAKMKDLELYVEQLRAMFDAKTEVSLL